MSRLDFIASETKRELLLLIKRSGAISLDDAESATGLARTTLREHLSQLEGDGLVSRTSHRQGRGRPSRRFHLTSDAEALFPARDGVLLRRLLAFLEEQGMEDLVRRFFERFWEDRRREFEFRLESRGADDPEKRVQVLEELLQDQGFMPQVEIEGEHLTIKECNCPFPAAVRHTRLPCRLEAEFFERVLEKKMDRVTYIPDGNASCTYRMLRTD